ncbi:MAG: family 16 glycosylhydrolase, partial [Methylacidiphilales bacterium]|nr:family 16 glycosylhydrolase [Candidatus Methylacidiphilales bacterium]
MKIRTTLIQTCILAILALAAFFTPVANVQAQSDIDLTGYTLSFADEFNSVSVTSNSPKGSTTWYYWPPYGSSGGYSDSVWDTAAFTANGGILTDKAWINTNDVASRTSWTGWEGFRFTTGGSPVVINSVGRWVISGNSQSHVVKLIDASNGVDVPNGSASVNTAGQPAGAFAYANLTTPVTLAANHDYFLMTYETAGGDAEYDCGYPQIITTSAIINRDAVWYDGNFHDLDFLTFGPVGMKSGSTELVTVTALGKWHSGNLSSVDTTRAGFSQQYGYFEIRCKMPDSASGAWPGFWLGTTNWGTGSKGVEVDIFEWYGVSHDDSPGLIAENTHNWNADGSQSEPPTALHSAQTPMPDGSKPWQAYHIYGCKVAPDYFTWYIDGVQVNQIPTPTAYVTAPFYVMIDYALGGGWPLKGMVNNSTFLVDWVRVYSLPTSSAATLTHKYTFNAGNFNDSVGTANGTLNGSASISGGALQLSGGSNGTAYGSLPTSVLSGLTSASFEGWFTESAIANWEKVFFPGNTDTSSFLGLTSSEGNDGHGRVDFLATGSSQQVAVGPLVSTGTKYYFACVYDAAGNTQSLYIAPVGGSLGSPVTTSLGGKNVSNINFVEFWLGRSPFGGDQDFAGSIDEF